MDTMPAELPVVVLAALATVEGEPGVPVIRVVAKETLAVVSAEELNILIGASVDVLLPYVTAVLVVALVSDFAKLADVRVDVGEFDAPVSVPRGVPLTALAPVLAFDDIELAEIAFVVAATVVIGLAAPWVEVKDLTVELRMSEDIVVGVVVVMMEATTVPVIALLSDIAILVDFKLSVSELGLPVMAPVGALITVLVAVLVSNVGELAEIEMAVVATLVDVEVKDVAVKLLMLKVVVVALVSDIVTPTLDVPVNVPVGVLLTVVVLVIVLVSEIVKLADPRVRVEEVDVEGAKVEDDDVVMVSVVFVDVIVGTVLQTPQVSPWQDSASTTKHQAPAVWPSGLQQCSEQE